MYKNILVPMALDHGIGEQTLQVAQALLSEGGSITALHVYEAPQGAAKAYIDGDLISAAYDRAKARMDERVAGLPNVRALMIKGHSGRGIIDVSVDIKADCIVIGSHKPGLIDYFLGSTAARVVQHAPCAVHVLREQ